MISVAEVRERAAEWLLPEEIVEKDYVLGWVLWGIANDPRLSATWAFKGGTCLKKCYVETYRFSEDLDFTVLEGGPLDPEELVALFYTLLSRVTTECGIDFSAMPPRFKQRPHGRTVEGRIYYRGPRNAPSPASVKVDLSADEKVVRPSVLREVQHPYSDGLPAPRAVLCYSFEELFAEKIRALGERCRPRDLYDIINLYRREDLRAYPELIRSVLVEKCESKGVPLTTYDLIANSPFRGELESEWKNMLIRQLPALPPFQEFWGALLPLFEWLEGKVTPTSLPALPGGAEDVPEWTPPPTVWRWGSGVPLESVRFAGANHLCIDLGYEGTTRRIEPYALRRTRDGHLLLYAVRVDNQQIRAYRVDRIQHIRVTAQPFTPRYCVEFSAGGGLLTAPPLSSPPTARAKVKRTRTSAKRGLVYVIQCPTCGKQFTRQTQNLTLRDHKANASDRRCRARRGVLVKTRYQSG